MLDKRPPSHTPWCCARVDPQLRMARFYSLMIEGNLFGTVRLVRGGADPAANTLGASRATREYSNHLYLPIYTVR